MREFYLQVSCYLFVLLVFMTSCNQTKEISSQPESVPKQLEPIEVEKYSLVDLKGLFSIKLTKVDAIKLDDGKAGMGNSQTTACYLDILQQMRLVYLMLRASINCHGTQPQLEFVSCQQFYVGVVEDFLIHCQQRAVIDTSRSNNNLISRITMKLSRKLCRVNDYLWRERKQLYSWVMESCFQPFINRAVKNQSFKLNQFGNFPTRKDIDP